MSQMNNSSTDTLTRLFERLARWMGVSTNTAPVLSTFIHERYRENRRLSSEDICKLTGYSRANAGLIITNLEEAGIIDGVRDYGQPGRGRKRVLYTLTGGIDYMIQMGIKNQIHQLSEMMNDLEQIQNGGSDYEKSMKSLLTDFENIVDNCIHSIDTLQFAQKTQTITKSD